MPGHGLFVEQRLRQLLSSKEVESRVVAPVPWFPSRNPMFGEYATFAQMPGREIRHGIQIAHPRFLRLPKVGMTLAPLAMANASLPILKGIESDGYHIDLIDAHYFYPDGVAAVMLASRLNKPVIITARGTDINLIPRYRLPRAMIRWAASRANGVAAVCNALKDEMMNLGVPAEKIDVLRNGVDLDFFQPVDKQLARARLGFDREEQVLISVGLLINRKGHDIAIRALQKLPGVRLIIVGHGHLRHSLEALSREVGVAKRVIFTGRLSQESLRLYYGLADALVLASSREGWANVLLEAMASGTPVIASDVWGSPEVVNSPDAGVLMKERTPAGLIDAYRRLMETTPCRHATRRHAEKFGWSETTRAQIELMRNVVDSNRLAT